MAARGAGQGHGRACRDPRLAAWEPEPSCDLRCHVEDPSDLGGPFPGLPWGLLPGPWGAPCAVGRGVRPALL